MFFLILACLITHFVHDNFSLKDKINTEDSIQEEKINTEDSIKKENINFKDNAKKENKPKKEEIKETKNNYVSYNGWLNIKDNKLVNQYGEIIQLKGISTHGIQWYGYLATKENMKILKEEWNSNLFRIAMYTEEGGYLSNKNLKEEVKRIVDYAIELDMYVIIDWHILTNGDPLSTKEEAIKFFDEMSNLYKDVPNVIYELCNEPNNTFWDNNIKPYSEAIIKTIRKNSNSIIIVGTNAWSQDIEDAVRNPIDDEKTMYALHFYAGSHTDWLRDRAKVAIEKIPLFVSEWGTSAADGNGGNYFGESDKWIEFMNENNLSWTNWSLTNKNESSALLKEECISMTDDCLTKNGLYIKNKIKNKD